MADLFVPGESQSRFRGPAAQPLHILTGAGNTGLQEPCARDRAPFGASGPWVIFVAAPMVDEANNSPLYLPRIELP